MHALFAVTLALALALAAATRASGDPVVLPDLTVDLAELSATLRVTTSDLTDACLVDGGCIPSLGEHTLLRFSTRTPNIAPVGGDLVIGPPPVHANPGLGLMRVKTVSAAGVAVQWEWHPCHQHWHLVGYVSAQLLFAGNMSEATATAKHSFCLRDTACTRDGVSPGFTCSNQGIKAGCHDTYSVNVPCQWIVIDGLPRDADYVLRLTVDPSDFIQESNETNNVVELPFRLEDVPVSAATHVEVDALLWLVTVTLACEIWPL